MKKIKKIFKLGRVQKSDSAELEKTLITKTQKIIPKKTIFLIGSTGKGKSALANVLVNKNNNFEEIFKESNYGVSETREIKDESFKADDVEYLVVDTVGIHDTKLSKEEVLDKIAEAVYLTRNGISQVFFITSGRFDQYEMSTYNLLKAIIFDGKVVNYTTIIRTHFTDFWDQKKCREDISLMINDKESELAGVVNSCNGTIHVDNPSLNLTPADNEDGDENERKRREDKIAKRKATRSKSRRVLLEHLSQVCQNQEFPYQPSKLKNLSDEIFDYMEEKIRKRKELAEKERQRKELEKTFNENTTTPKLTSNSEEIIKEVKKRKEELEAELSETKNKLQSFENDKSSPKLITKSRISFLEKEIKELTSIKELKKGIQKADEQIRQVVFNHIFNNINDIAKVTGSDDFLNSFAKDNNNSTIKLSIAELKKQRTELEAKLLERKVSDQSLEKIKNEIEEKKQELLNLKKELLNDEKVLAKWQERGFSIDQAQEWADILKNIFDPENGALFCAWLRDNKELTTEEVENYDAESIENLRTEYVTVRNVNAQEWLDEEYPKAIRGSLTKLVIKDKNLTGSLNLSDFPNLEKLDCSKNQLSNLDVSNCIKLKKLVCYSNKLAGLVLDNCPQLEKIDCRFNVFTILKVSNQPSLRELICYYNCLTTLIVTDNPQLTELDCFTCKLTTLSLDNNPHLAKIWCQNNQLSNLNFLNALNPKCLVTLDISDNNFRDNLSLFSKFVNLEELHVGGNFFTGSLSPLQFCQKLEWLTMGNTQINDGLEYLPKSVKKIRCAGQLARELKNYEKDGFYNYQSWRKDNQELIEEAQQKKETFSYLEDLLPTDKEKRNKNRETNSNLAAYSDNHSLNSDELNDLNPQEKAIEKETKKQSYLGTFLFPKYIYIKADNGKFLSREKNKLNANKSNSDQHCLFLVENLGKNQVALQADSGLWITFNSNSSHGDSITLENRNYQFNNQIFTIIRDAGDCVYLKNPKGFLSKNKNDKLVVQKNADENCKFIISGAYISREIIDIRYDIGKSIIRKISPLVVLRAEIKNISSSPAKQILSYTYTKSEVGTWNNSAGIEIGLKTSFSAGIPFLNKDKIEVELGNNYTREWGGSKNIEKTIMSTTEITIPVGKVGIALATVKRAEIEVPFSYIEKIGHHNGKTEEIIHKSTGVYKNLESYHMDFEIKDLADIKQQVEDWKTQIQIPPK